MSEPLEIVLFPGEPLYSMRVVLDGKEYVLRFDWNGRESRWYFSIGFLDGSWLRTGIKFIANWPFLRNLADTRKPPGLLIAIDLSPSNGEPPGLLDIGERVKLFYYPA